MPSIDPGSPRVASKSKPPAISAWKADGHRVNVNVDEHGTSTST